MALPKRFLGGVDPAAAQSAIDAQRRRADEATARLAAVEAQLATVQAERAAAEARLREMEAQIADVLRLATRAAHETEAETAERVAEATEQAQKRVDDLAVEAATAAETAAALAEALQEAVRTYRALLPIEVATDSGGSATAAVVDAPQSAAEVPEEPFVLDHEPPVVVVEEAEAATPTAAEQPPTYTTVVARPLPSPAAAVEVERRLVGLRGVREVTLQKLGSTEAEFLVAHDPGALDLTPLTRLGVPVSLA